MHWVPPREGSTQGIAARLRGILSRLCKTRRPGACLRRIRGQLRGEPAQRTAQLRWPEDGEPAVEADQVARRPVQVVRPEPQEHSIRPPLEDPQRRRSEEHTSELQSHSDLVCRLLLEKKNKHTHKNDVLNV